MKQDSFTPAICQGQGIWKYADLLLPRISVQNRITLDEGATPLEDAASRGLRTGGVSLHFKREDLNPTGSHKARSLAYRISLSLERREPQVVISSSGNAALNALAYGTQAGIHVYALVSPKTEAGKIAALIAQAKAPFGHLAFSDRAMRMAAYLSARFGMPNLRPSLDDDSLTGYATIAFELAEQLPSVDHIFSFVTSGSSLLGIYQGFIILKAKGLIGSIPSLHAVQSGSGCSIARAFAPAGEIAEEANLPFEQNLGGKDTRRSVAAVEAVRQTRGSGWFVRAEEIDQATKQLEKAGILTSWEGCASFAALQKAGQQGAIKGNAVCILTGKRYPSDNAGVVRLPLINSFDEAGSWAGSNL